MITTFASASGEWPEKRRARVSDCGAIGGRAGANGKGLRAIGGMGRVETLAGAGE